MSEPRFTPGPWKAEEGEDWLAQYVYGGDGRPLCLVYTSEVHMHTARLIAAAPDLLEALHDLLEALHALHLAPVHDFNRLRNGAHFSRARAVIAKALGDE